MNPTNKHPVLEAEITRLFGHDRRAAIEKNVCVPPPIGCGKLALQFRDELSRREFAISGLCQDCQDTVFGAPRKKRQRKSEPAHVIGPNDYAVVPMEMKCGGAEAECHRYHKHVISKPGKRIGCVWLVSDQPNAADNVYFHDPTDTKSQGFGGGTLTFPLVGGGEYVAKGPWHGNSDSLFADTGVDVRDTCLTFVVLAMEREYPKSNGYSLNPIMRDVVYRDAEPTIGRFDRYKELIKAHPQAKWYYMQSSGGSSCGQTSNP